MVRFLILIAMSFVFCVQADTCNNIKGPSIGCRCPSGTGWVPVGNPAQCCLPNDIVRCADKINLKTGKSDCPGMTNYCTNSAYRDLMRDECPKTCGYCPVEECTSSVPPTTCVDKMNPQTPGQSDCPRMKSYCNTAGYVDLMKDQCPKTCGYC